MYENFEFSSILKTKWPKSEEILNFGGGWVWVPMNINIPTSPQSKLRLATPLTVGIISGRYPVPSIEFDLEDDLEN